MTPHHFLFLAPLVLSLVAAPAAFARKGEHHEPGHEHHEPFHEDHFDDDSRGERREAFCKDNPATCEQIKLDRENRRKHCEANPKHCEALKAEREKRRAKMREWCEKNPAECEKRREGRRERRGDRS